MKLPNNYYADQFRKLGIQTANELNNNSVKIKLFNDIGNSNYINIDDIALTEIYNVLQSLDQRYKG